MINQVYRVWRRHGARGMVRQLSQVLHQASAAAEQRPAADVAGLTRDQFRAQSALPVRTVAGAPPRLNLVTDTINPPHLYGGVGTAMIFGALLAERLGRGLRIVTRHAPPDAKNFQRILHVGGLRSPEQVEFAFSSFGADGPSLPISADDLFITTSWWTTFGARQTVPPRQIIYLLQEDERMFYPYGDEHLRCSETLGNPDMSYLVNTELLFDYFVGTGLKNIAEHGVWFEPSFSEYMFYAEERPRPRPPYQFLFYARPHNLRNLFYRGIEAIEAAVASGVLPPREWELNLVGKDIPRVVFSGGVEPRCYENLSWQAYAALIRKMDLGMSLMYTPHPSYPPLDLAASGAVVVTNRFGPKQDLDRYSQNILCRDLSVEDLVRGIAEGVALCKDGPRRQANYQRTRLLRDWRASFAAALDRLAPKLGQA